MKRGEKISFEIGLVMALIDIVIGIMYILLSSICPGVALSLEKVFVWGFALCLIYLTTFAVVFIIRNI